MFWQVTEIYNYENFWKQSLELIYAYENYKQAEKNSNLLIEMINNNNQPHPSLSNHKKDSCGNQGTEPGVKVASFDSITSKRFIFGNGVFSKLFVSWVTPIVDKGYKQQLSYEHIPQLQENDRMKYKLQKFQKIFSEQTNEKRTPGLTLIRTFIKFQFKEQIIFFLVNVLILICKIGILVFNQQLVKYIQQEQRTLQKNIKYFFTYAGLIFFEMFGTDNLFYMFRILDQDFIYLLSLMIYKKMLSYPVVCSKEFELSQIINYSQIDAHKLGYLHWQITVVFNSIFYVAACLCLLSYFVGFVTVFCLLLLSITAFISFILFGFIQKIENTFYQAKDKTVKLLEWILQSINFIKFNTLQKYVQTKIQEKREEQLTIMTRYCLLKALINFIFSLISPIMVITLFLCYLKFYNEHISTPLAFMVLTIFNNIQGMAQDLPQWLSHLISVWISIKRIQKFLIFSPIKQQLQIKSSSLLQNAVQIKNGVFQQSFQPNQQQLQNQRDQKSSEVQKTHLRVVFDNLNIQFKKGKLTIITGSIGSGKTSLLYCILNQMKTKDQSLSIHGSIAYSSQKPWLFNGTIKQNIIFHSQYDQKRLRQAIEFSCLSIDLKKLKKGINEKINERGSNLSGGQKARISLARAIYSNKDIFILDDVLSALDINVYKLIIENTLKGFLRNKTIIMATNDVKLLAYADEIYEIRDFKIIKLDKNQINLRSLSDFTRNNQNTKNKEFKQNERKISLKIQQQQTYEVEQAETGDFPAKLYIKFLALSGNKAYIVLIIILFTAWSVLTYLSNIQIQNWCQDLDKNRLYLYLYSGLILISGISLTFASFFIIVCQLNKNRKLLKNITQSLLNAGITEFFNRTPSGRILNRLTNDLISIDFLHFHQTRGFLVSLFSIISCFIAFILVFSAIALIPITILVVILLLYLNYFINSEQECLRMEKVSNSSIVGGFTQTFEGLVVIRAFKKSQQMLMKQQQKIDTTRQISITRISLEYWLLIRDSLIIYISILITVLYCIFNEQKSGSQLGLILLYAISFSQQVGIIFPNILNFRQKMVQFERLNNLCQIQPEKGYKEKEENSQDQILRGASDPSLSIEFINYSCRYRQDLPFALKNISIKIPKGSKVGLVGRTGAGKTSIFNSLLRVLQPIKGSLFINGHQIREQKLQNLRNSFAIIQQNPTVIEGSIRENLDPMNLYSDSEVCKVLNVTKLGSLLGVQDCLNYFISNQSISAGHKQIVSICRAILKKAQIVLMDEPTANIDQQLSGTIHQIMNQFFKYSTVITIAHKLSTLKNYDYIIVLQNGSIAQFGEARELMRINSIYRKMWENNDSLFLA